MAAKMSGARRRAFFAALAATGNQTIAAERARVSRSWVRLHRNRDPAFRHAIDEAVAAARERLIAAGGIAPPTGWGSLDGDELTVRGGTGRRVQIRRARLDEFSPRVEARFLAVVAATCNVLAACAAIGMSPAALYRQRQRREGFAKRWQQAIEEGYLRLETGLLERANNLFSGEAVAPGDEDPLLTGPITVEQAMQLWFHHRQHVIGIGSPRRRWRREMPIEEVRAEVLRRVEVMLRSKDMAEGEMVRARREWAARGLRVE